MKIEFITVAQFPYQEDETLLHILIQFELANIAYQLKEILSSTVDELMSPKKPVKLRVPISQMARALEIVHLISDKQ